MEPKRNKRCLATQPKAKYLAQNKERAFRKELYRIRLKNAHPFSDVDANPCSVSQFRIEVEENRLQAENVVCMFSVVVVDVKGCEPRGSQPLHVWRVSPV